MSADPPVVSVAARRNALARRHRLVDRSGDAVGATSAMVVLHATDPATVYLSAMARTIDPSIEAVAAALYDDRSLARVLAMRRTLFVVPVPDLAVVERSSTDRVAIAERKRLVKFMAETGIEDPTAWLAEARDEVEAAVGPEGLQAREITEAVPRLATKIVMGAGTKHEVTAGATSRVLGILANEGSLMRGRPQGAWTGRTYRWHLRPDWLGSTDPDPDSHTEESAAVELVRRWLASFGPGTFDDIVWWTGWTKGRTKAALAALDASDGLVEVDLDGGGAGLVLADDLDGLVAGDDPGPWAALLPALDPTPMGWKEREWYLGDHQGPLFDRNGNIGPTVWADGRIVGGWSQRPDGEVVYRLLDDVGADHRSLIDAEAERLQALVGDVIVKPSFPTPLQKELSAG